MILVAGSTGMVGTEVCRRLVDRGHTVRALTRESSAAGAVARLRALGAEVVVGDLRDRASLDEACAGVDTVISTASATGRGESIESTDGNGQLQLVEAARAAGVAQFIFVSVTGTLRSNDALTNAKRSVERSIRESGMTYTILRPTQFMEVWLSPATGFDYPNAAATICGTGEQPLSYISLNDVAEFAVRSVTNTSARNAILELGGPQPVTPLEAVRLFEQESGRAFTLTHVPVEVLRQQYDAATEPTQRAFAALMLAYAEGNSIPMERVLQAFQIPLLSVADYAASVVQPAPRP